MKPTLDSLCEQAVSVQDGRDGTRSEIWRWMDALAKLDPDESGEYHAETRVNVIDAVFKDVFRLLDIYYGGIAAGKVAMVAAAACELMMREETAALAPEKGGAK